MTTRRDPTKRDSESGENQRESADKKVSRVIFRSINWCLRFLILYIVSKAVVMTNLKADVKSRELIVNLYENGFLIYFVIIVLLDFVEVFSETYTEKISIFITILTLLVLCV